MPAKNPRVITVLDTETYSILCAFAQKDKISISKEVWRAVREYIERHEDEYLYDVSKKRFNKFLKNKKLISFDEAKNK